jgi:hypothetical protein
MEAEPPLVAGEGRERSGAADVGHPWARLDLRRDVRDRRVGDAEKDELRPVLAHGDAPLAQASGDRGADAARADHVNAVEQFP